MSETVNQQQRTCNTHGPYQATRLYGSVWTSCQACQREREEQEQRREEERARLALAQRTRERMGDSGIGLRFLEAGFDNYVAVTPKQRAVREACRDYAAHFGSGAPGAALWLVGPAGVGKTHLGCAMVADIITRHGKPAHIASARAIVRRLRDTWRHPGGETEGDVIDAYAKYALLVIDEAGAGFGTEAEQVQLFDVLDERYQRQLPTALISNYTPTLLRAALGDRNYDRLREGAKVLAMDWPSYRRPASE